MQLNSANFFGFYKNYFFLDIVEHQLHCKNDQMVCSNLMHWLGISYQLPYYLIIPILKYLF